MARKGRGFAGRALGGRLLAGPVAGGGEAERGGQERAASGQMEKKASALARQEGLPPRFRRMPEGESGRCQPAILLDGQNSKA